jgi:hypothetical protein
MDGLSIRAATETDVEALCRLYYHFHEFHVRGVPERLRSLGNLETQDFAELREGIRKIL